MNEEENKFRKEGNRLDICMVVLWEKDSNYIGSLGKFRVFFFFRLYCVDVLVKCFLCRWEVVVRVGLVYGCGWFGYNVINGLCLLWYILF